MNTQAEYSIIDHLVMMSTAKKQQAKQRLISGISQYIFDNPDVSGRSRKAYLVAKRMYISYLLHRVCEVTLVNVGIKINRDHSSIVHLLKGHDKFTAYGDIFYYESINDFNREMINMHIDVKELIHSIKKQTA